MLSIAANLMIAIEEMLFFKSIFCNLLDKHIKSAEALATQVDRCKTNLKKSSEDSELNGTLNIEENKHCRNILSPRATDLTELS